MLTKRHNYNNTHVITRISIFRCDELMSFSNAIKKFHVSKKLCVLRIFNTAIENLYHWNFS